MYPVILQIGPVTIYSFGLMMAVAFLVAGLLTSRELGRKGYNPELGSSLVLWAAVGGLVGARLFLILEDPKEFFEHPLSTIFSGSGFVWYGGLFGGMLATYVAVRRAQVPWLEVADAAAPTLALGHAIGRIGCQLAGDGDWGRVTTLPWGMAYPRAIVGWPYPPGVVVHPTPLYEALAYTAIFLFLWSRRTNVTAPGSLLWLYFVLAGSARFLVEFVRVNPVWWLGLTQAQWISLALVAAGMTMLLRHKIAGSAQPRALRS
ncbi:MAG: prolipoprotein diacylglyceryl transferase [Candidatus Binatia bacterium]|nr:MAG: prolipoprotein diacylglyceryl transferase [Candidatus Binatia bacterium]